MNYSSLYEELSYDTDNLFYETEVKTDTIARSQRLCDLILEVKWMNILPRSIQQYYKR